MFCRAGIVVAALGLLSAWPIEFTAQGQQPVWVIAHRANDESDIGTALGDGANAIEFDVVSEGNSFKVRHPGSIDFHIPSLQSYLSAAVQERSRIRLAYIDYKGPDFSQAARTRLVDSLRSAGIPESGIRVLISTASLANSGFFQGFPQEAWLAPQFDEDNTPDAVHQFFASAGITRAWYGDGITNLAPEPPRVKANIRAAIARRDAGSVIKGVVIWTLDDRSPMRDYLRLGVNAILTNDPDDTIAVLAEPEFSSTKRLATNADAPW
jgi:hypothetical protein